MVSGLGSYENNNQSQNYVAEALHWLFKQNFLAHDQLTLLQQVRLRKISSEKMEQQIIHKIMSHDAGFKGHVILNHYPKIPIPNYNYNCT